MCSCTTWYPSCLCVTIITIGYGITSVDLSCRNDVIPWNSQHKSFPKCPTQTLRDVDHVVQWQTPILTLVPIQPQCKLILFLFSLFYFSLSSFVKILSLLYFYVLSVKLVEFTSIVKKSFFNFFQTIRFKIICYYYCMLLIFCFKLCCYINMLSFAFTCLLFLTSIKKNNILSFSFYVAWKKTLWIFCMRFFFYLLKFIFS